MVLYFKYIVKFRFLRQNTLEILYTLGAEYTYNIGIRTYKSIVLSYYDLNTHVVETDGWLPSIIDLDFEYSLPQLSPCTKLCLKGSDP